MAVLYYSSIEEKIAALEAAKSTFASTLAIGARVQWTVGLAQRIGTVADVGVEEKTGEVVYVVTPERMRERPDLAGKPCPAVKVFSYQNIQPAPEADPEAVDEGEAGLDAEAA